MMLLALLGRSATAYNNASAPALPRLGVDATGCSVSGISSGADFAVQLQVAYSSLFAGVGVFAGQAYHCAVQRFAGDELKPPDARVPFCDGCPSNTTLPYDHCKTKPEIADDVSPLVAYARTQEANGAIDALDTLAHRRVFLYRGKSDSTYKAGSVNATANFFRAFVPETSIRFERSVDSEHLVPGIDPYLCWWEEWSGPDNCTFDGARAALEWIYGPDALALGRDNDTETLAGQLRPFDQRPYFPGDGRDPLLDEEGLLFVPRSCETERGCRLHVFLHGCGVSPTYPVFTKYAGFNEWAVKNRIVVMYPKMSTRGKISQEHSGCYDGYGQTGSDYDVKSGSQMETIAKMVLALQGSDVGAFV